MKPKVLIAYSGFGDLEVETQVLARINANVNHVGNLSSPEALAAVREADALMVTLQKVTADIIHSMKRCRVISRAGTGIDTIDVEAATARGIWVAYVPDYSIDEVSTHAISLLLTQARGIVPLVNSTRNGKWDNMASGPVYRLKEQTLGIIGFGRIGQAAAEKGRGLGLNVLVYDPYPNQAVAERIGARFVDLETLARQSDYISLHTPLLDSTRHMINAHLLAMMKPTVYIVNAARGPLIDEEALLAAVRTKQIAGAALDVLAVEPIAPDSPLLREERILITPHSAWYSEEAKIDLRTRCAEEVVRVLSGQTPRSPVNQVTG
jgi:D-3-phosphoglycerate dehydrogenase